MFVWEGQECMGRKYFNSSVFLHSDASIQNFEEEIWSEWCLKGSCVGCNTEDAVLDLQEFSFEMPYTIL